MASRKFFGLFTFVSLFSLLSCGGSGGGGSSSGSEKNPQREDEPTQKLYRAILKPVNAATVGETTGVVMIRIDGDELVVEQTMTDAPGGVRHFQAIMSGSSCATIDQNADSYFDLAEASASIGKRLIPMDSNLDSQLEGSDFGPISNGANAYIYRRTASLAKMMADLTSLDPDEDDDLVKIKNEKSLRLDKRVVVVMGTDRSVPDSVIGNGTYSAADGLPIACGELKAIRDENEEVE